MTTTTTPRDSDAPEERVPWQQRLLDNIFLLTAAGLIVPTLFYVVWGLYSLLTVPAFNR